MVSVNERLQLKSFYYKLSSIDVGYNIYKNDQNIHSIFLGKLVCRNCGETWETSSTECYYCGSSNYNLYTCINCGNKVSVAVGKNHCPYCQSEKTLHKLCLNNECPTNNKDEYPELCESVRKGDYKTSGVFARKSGNTIRQNSCKNCGCRINEYKSSELTVVTSISKLKEDLHNKDGAIEVYLERDSEMTPIKHYHYIHNNKLMETDDIKKFAHNITDFDFD